MRRFCSFDGRAARSEWWGINVVVLLPASLLVRTLLADPNVGTLMSTILLLASIPLIWISIAVSVRRLHDLNKEGIWYLISFVPVIGSAWLLIYCGFLQGTAGPNRYGERGPSPFDLPR
jgi:uncharacterized membrane protein YhaH (DUF805 family)